MRDIKFRAWCTKSEEMRFDLTVGEMLNEGLATRSIPFMQFTGLTDMNGVDIYEGDIVKSHFYTGDFDCIAEVYYCDAEARYKFKDSEVDAYVYGIENNCLEVVGHIYER